MYKVTVLYGPPDSAEEFDRYYDETHIPLAQRMTDLELVLDSQAGVEANQDLDNFATGGAVFLFGEEREVPVR